MTPSDHCLSHLEALVEGKSENAVLMAESYIEELLQTSLGSRLDGARVLGDIQAQLLRRTGPSPLRSDVFDLLGDHIVRLLEPEDGL